ncbi:MAG: TIGR02996 domain-containing protein [Gemmataceae bacterium]
MTPQTNTPLALKHLHNAEEAFLSALDENPLDETTRLVYSDWLEEHGDERRAAFLRFKAPTEGNALARLMADLEEDWCFRAGRRWDVVLTLYPPARKILIIKTIRELRRINLSPAKDLSERAQPILLPGVPPLLAVQAAQALLRVAHQPMRSDMHGLDDSRPILVQLRPSGADEVRPLVRGVPCLPTFEGQRFLRLHSVRRDRIMTTARLVAEIADCSVFQALDGLLGPLPVTVAQLFADEQADLIARFTDHAEVRLYEAWHDSPAGQWVDLVIPAPSSGHLKHLRPHLVRLLGHAYTALAEDQSVEYLARRLPRFFAEELLTRLSAFAEISLRLSDDQP